MRPASADFPWPLRAPTQPHTHGVKTRDREIRYKDVPLHLRVRLEQRGWQGNPLWPGWESGKTYWINWEYWMLRATSGKAATVKYYHRTVR